MSRGTKPLRRAALRRFAAEGWTSARLLPQSVCGSLRAAFDAEVAPHPGPLPRQLSAAPEPHRRSADGWIVNPVHNPRALTRFPRFAATEREVMRNSPLVAAVAQLLGEPPALLQAAWYESSLGTLPHLDFNPLERGAPMVGVWLALEDIGPEAGRFVVWPGSHRIPRSEQVERFAEVAWRAWRGTFVEHRETPEQAEAQSLLRAITDAHGLHPCRPALRAGDALFWSSALVHGSDPPRPGGGSRTSLVMHFVGMELVQRRQLPTA